MSERPTEHETRSSRREADADTRAPTPRPSEPPREAVPPGEEALRSLMGRFGDRIVRFAEETLGDEIDERLSRVRTHVNDAGFDPFGFDPKAARYGLALTAFFHRFYFRTEVFGIDRVPEGRVLVIANHSGQIPLDGMMLGTSLVLDADPPRFPRAMVERWTAELPFVSVVFPRMGQVMGAPENARRLLEQDEALIVFPEGARGISKTFDKRYQLEEFGLGFMRLALETQTPIVPVAIIGGEEQYPSVANFRPLARLLGAPAFPIIPQTFVGMMLPLPTRYRLHFGEPMHFSGDPDDDDAVIEQKVGDVKQTIQSMLHRGLRERKSVFF